MSQEDALIKAVQELYDLELEKKARRKKIFPPNPPNEVCENAYIKGLAIENSFGPYVGELNHFFDTEYEKIFIWTHNENVNSAIVTEVNPIVKDISFWKNIGNIMWMVIQADRNFEGISAEDFEYKWMYYFDESKTLEEQVFNNLGMFDDVSMKNGPVLKATDIARLAPEIELLLRDDKAYTALMMLCNSFIQHYICLTCELSRIPYHDHLSEEPKIWEHASIIPNMEAAIVQACRSVEGIMGAPPNSRKQVAVLKHKEKWKELTGIDPDSEFEKAGISYWDYYHELFHFLRNPSAHSYGNIHYELERSNAVQAQCFASIIVFQYLKKHELNLEEAQDKLNFNLDLLNKVVENMSTCITKEKPV